MCPAVRAWFFPDYDGALVEQMYRMARSAHMRYVLVVTDWGDYGICCNDPRLSVPGSKHGAKRVELATNS